MAVYSTKTNFREILSKQAPFIFGCQRATLLHSNGDPIEYDTERGVFLLDHGTEYMVAIGNFHQSLRIVAKIEIDGVPIGNFEIEPNTVDTFERSSTVDRKFIFVDRNSQLGKQGKLHKKSVSELGCVKLTIRQAIEPEKNGLSSLMSDGCRLGSSMEGDDGCMDYVDGVGGTVLGRKSNVRYTKVPEFDAQDVCTCILRMALRPKVVPLE
jgi:hypothetical protein